MHLKSKIIPVKDTDEFIVVNGISNQFNEGPFDLLDTQHVSIKKYQLGSDTAFDLTSVCTLPFESSSQMVNELKKKAQVQLNQTKNKNLSQSEFNRYTNNFYKYSAAAKLAESDRRHLPVSIELCGDDHLLVGFVVTNSDESKPYDQKFIGTLRLVDIHSAEIIKEETVSCKGIATKARHHGEFIACSDDGEFALFHSISKGKFGFGSGDLTVVEKVLFSKLSFKKSQNELTHCHRKEVIATKDSWVAFKYDMDGCKLVELEYVSGKIINTIELAKNSENFDLSPSTHTAAIIHSNGMLSVVNIKTSKIVKFRIHVGVAKDSWLGVKISQNGLWVASSICDKELVIVNINTKQVFNCDSMQEIVMQREPLHSINLDTHIKPVYEFVNNKLVISDAQGIHTLDPLDLNFEDSTIKEKTLDLSTINIQSSLEDMLLKSDLKSKTDIISKYYSPSLQLNTELNKREFRKEPGKSQIGGHPDLPKGSSWPLWNQLPMSFLAQINLKEMYKINPHLNLPSTGLLSFFIGCEEECYDRDGITFYSIDLMLGNESKDKDGLKIIYTKDLSELSELKYPDSPKPETFASCKVIPSRGGNPLPDAYSPAYQQLNLKGVEIDNYNKLLSKVNDNPELDESWVNLLMGYPQLIQMNPPEIYCERASSGEDPFQQPTADQLNNSAKWTMILQLTSDPNPDFIWGDGGHFYFYSNREKAAIGDFSESWVYFEN